MLMVASSSAMTFSSKPILPLTRNCGVSARTGAVVSTSTPSERASAKEPAPFTARTTVRYRAPCSPEGSLVVHWRRLGWTQVLSVRAVPSIASVHTR